MTNADAYFEELTALLREQRMPHERIETLVRELKAYAEEAGSEAHEEFGPPEVLAAQLTERDRAGSAGALEEPGSEAETWVWTADALKEERLLNHFGDQGWEVERLDRAGRFVCRRDARQPMRWEYRRERVGRGDRARLSERLAPEGWEPCGVWVWFAYYKRPEAVGAGPAARLAEPPAAPRERVYIAKWVYAWIAAWPVVASVLIWQGLRGLDSLSGVAGALVGLLLCVLAGAGLSLWWRRSGGAASKESPRR
ncbi:hypothetical protein [Actinomadura sp. HBU206391]|uniref:hypothetical protein n=1 Tax=Actinomadura sp. HBU206391 TaxID=2731692 RepID=UPI00164F57E0|nr:hypothetical protein [Actinomadura sp. HBU206391]MBC6458369.1 hypothetical protein [Actinomadura sp. HBU206391]